MVVLLYDSYSCGESQSPSLWGCHSGNGVCLQFELHHLIEKEAMTNIAASTNASVRTKWNA